MNSKVTPLLNIPASLLSIQTSWIPDHKNPFNISKLENAPKFEKSIKRLIGESVHVISMVFFVAIGDVFCIS